MGWGTLTAEQAVLVGNFVRGKVVHDLGAGDCELALQMVKLGAAFVYAVDKKFPQKRRHHSRIIAKEENLHEYASDKLDVVFVSWPSNNDGVTDALIRLADRATTVIYLGKNDAYTQCGTPELFEYFSCRKLLAYEHNWSGSLLVLDAVLDAAEDRELTEEERCGIEAGRYPTV